MLSPDLCGNGTGMKRAFYTQSILLLVGAFLLAGCSTGLLGGGNKLGGPSATQTIPVGNNLALPPDLSLPPPGQGTDNYQANNSGGVASDESYDVASAEPKPLAPAVKRDIYADNNISKVKADGTEKTPTELQRELKAALLAKKRQQNPNYGTIFNIGSVFQE